jgi:uncharacterized membrane protein (DUF485 family)
MSNDSIPWQAVLESERFQRLARRRRTTVFTLGTIAAVYYFAIPALIAWAPSWFRIHVTDGFNLGTLFAVSQYPLGGLIAWAFLHRTAALDRDAQGLVERDDAPVLSGEHCDAY